MGLTNDVHVPYSLKERQAALEAALASSTFSRNVRLAKLLRYLCSKSFAGEAGSLKEFTIRRSSNRVKNAYAVPRKSSCRLPIAATEQRPYQRIPLDFRFLNAERKQHPPHQ